MKLKEIFSTIKQTLTTFAHYLLVVLGMVIFFAIGYYFNTFKELSKKEAPQCIKRGEVTIAIDESNNFLLMRKDGTYVILEDSIGKSIFNIYAKDIYSKNKVEVK